MTIIGFLRTLWHHRRMLQAQLVIIRSQKEQIAELEQAIRCRDHALASLATPPQENVEEPVLKPVRFQRRSYREEQLFQERQMSGRFREIDAKRRRDQAATR